MASPHPALSQIDLSPEPDLHPLYPNPTTIGPLLSADSGLSPTQKAELVKHCLTRSCVFADLALLNYVLNDPQAQACVDLTSQDDDGLSLVSLTIMGFGSGSDRDIEREECVRMLIQEGADVNLTDKEGWSALHYAALLAPPTLVSHLLTHGCHPLSLTRRKLTAFDIVTGHSLVPGRDNVALILEEAMRAEGWTGGRVEDQRRHLETKMQQHSERREFLQDISRTLGLGMEWWGDLTFEPSAPEESDNEDEVEDAILYTPPANFSSMLVFSPQNLDRMFSSLITNFPETIRNSEPANALYMLSRFACLTCDESWLEELIMGATDIIEETIFNRPDDPVHLTFWLYNTTVWLHLMHCDRDLNEMCEVLGSYVLVEEVINSVFVFLIRFVERRVDQLLDPCILDHSPLSSEFESVQFESEWSIIRTFQGGKKKAGPPPLANSSGVRPTSPSLQPVVTPSTPKAFSSLRQSFARRGSNATPLQAVFQHTPPSPSPSDVTSFLTAFHSLITSSGINPALITQLWSQVTYWTTCEVFNRILTRKKYICRSRAVQIGMNLSVVEEWISKMNLPPGVGSHFAPVRELLHWLQCLSSIDEFSNLIATIQMMKHLNPLQMRRAVRDYKYEVNEGRMTEECSQYLIQLQKDWERRRVKLGVEALRKGLHERDDDASSFADEAASVSYPVSSAASSVTSEASAQKNLDLLFDQEHSKSEWIPVKPPEVLGELLDSRFMLPLLLPSDPRMLAVFWGEIQPSASEKRNDGIAPPSQKSNSSVMERRPRSPMAWRSRCRKIRDIGPEMLQWVDGARSLHRWIRPVDVDVDDGEKGAKSEPWMAYDSDEDAPKELVDASMTFTRIPVGRKSHGRTSSIGDTELAQTPVDATIIGNGVWQKTS